MRVMVIFLDKKLPITWKLLVRFDAVLHGSML